MTSIKGSITRRITVHLMAFVGLLLAVIWILQTVLLPVLYRNYRSGKVLEAVNEIAIRFDSPLFYQSTSRIAREQSACVRVLRQNGTELFSVEYMPYCELHSFGKDELAGLAVSAEAGGGSFSSIYSMDSPRLQQIVPTGVEAILFAKVFTPEDGEPVVVFFNCTITPITGIIEIQSQYLLWLIVVTLITALGLSIWVSLYTARPITKLNEQARLLKVGNYNVVFDSSDYMEVAELSKTLNAARREMETLEGLRRELIANVSHDLRTPLSRIIAYSELMRDLPGENTPENVQVVIDEANQLSTLVSEVLLHPTQSGNLEELNHTTYDIAKSCRETIRRYQKMNGGYNFRYEGPDRARVHADEVKIYQVVYNLLTNAMNHIGPSGEIILSLIPLVDEHKIRVEVSDNGTGISADKLPLIWKKYYSASGDGAFHTGLGLTIVRRILELHGAAYGVDSEEGTGSTFWFTLDLIGLN